MNPLNRVPPTCYLLLTKKRAGPRAAAQLTVLPRSVSLALEERQNRLGHGIRLHESCHRRLLQNLRLAQVGGFSGHIGIAD